LRGKKNQIKQKGKVLTDKGCSEICKILEKIETKSIDLACKIFFIDRE
jgi:hypothetical protein